MKTKKTLRANIEKKRFIFMEIGIILALVLAITAFEWKSKVNEPPVLVSQGGTYEEETWVKITDPDKIKLPPPPPMFEIVLVENNTTIIDPVEIPTVDVDENTDIGIYIPDDKEEETEDKEYINVQIMPKFRNKHHNEFSKFIAGHVKYPKIAEENQVEGTVYVKFVINEKGNLVNAKIYKGIDPALDEEVLRVVNQSEKWTPGIQNLKPVKVSFIFPVKFELTKNSI